MSALRISLGADPELFLRDKKTGKFVSAHTVLPGTKLEPHKVTKGAVQVDGVAAEFNIDPSFSSDQFVTNIDIVRKHLQGFVGDLELVDEPVAIFDPEYFKTLPEDVRTLGCNPDWNAWTGQINESPDGNTFMRTASGHIHLGWTKDADILDPTHIEDCRIIVRQLDYYLGIYSLLWDPDPRRRTLYGKAGCMRVKPYGLEYRTMSNVWLRSPRLQEWVFNAAFAGAHSLINDNKSIEDKHGDSARKIIDEGIVDWIDRKEFKSIHGFIGQPMPPNIEKPKEVPVEKKARYIYKTRVNGSDSPQGQTLMSPYITSPPITATEINGSISKVGKSYKKIAPLEIHEWVDPNQIEV